MATTSELWDFTAWRALTREEIDRCFPRDGEPRSVLAAYGHPDSPVEGDEPAFLLIDHGEVSFPTRFAPGMADPAEVSVPFPVLQAAEQHFLATLKAKLFERGPCTAEDPCDQCLVYGRPVNPQEVPRG